MTQTNRVIKLDQLNEIKNQKQSTNKTRTSNIIRMKSPTIKHRNVIVNKRILTRLEHILLIVIFITQELSRHQAVAIEEESILKKSANSFPDSESQESSPVRTNPRSIYVTATSLDEEQANKTSSRWKLKTEGVSRQQFNGAGTTIFDVALVTTMTPEQPTSMTTKAISSTPNTSSVQNNQNNSTNTKHDEIEQTVGGPAKSGVELVQQQVRPSLQEMASELSRKHLNLSNENWRIKSLQTNSSSTHNNNSTDLNNQELNQDQTSELNAPKYNSSTTNDYATTTTTATSAIPTLRNIVSDATSISNIELVQDVQRQQAEQLQPALSNFDEDNASIAADEDDSSQKNQSASAANVAPASNTTSKSEEASGGVETSVNSKTLSEDANSAGKGGKNFVNFVANRRSKSARQTVSDSSELDNELQQCKEYLIRNQAAYTQLPAATSSLVGADLTRLISPADQFPCSCVSRQHFAAKTPKSSVVLNCDNVQLVGGQLWSSRSGPSINSVNKTGDNNYQQQNEATWLTLTSFSQRDSGLQRVNSQKFLELQLARLRSIDLSSNRIRQIRADAFHALETQLEYLNLANNFLGDYRSAPISTLTQTPSSSKLDRQQSVSQADSNQQLVFASNELNKLRKLKWLSLRNNQIARLSPSIFTKQIQIEPAGASSSELVELDLSENLLEIIPSDSISLLNRLERLDLSHNKLKRLDDTCKFPKALKYLDLSGNLLDTIYHSNLIDLAHLLELNLAQNQLTRLDKSAFVSANNLIANNLILSLGAERKSLAPVRDLAKSGASDELINSNQASKLRQKRSIDEQRPDEMEVDDLEADESAVVASASSRGVNAMLTSQSQSYLQVEQFNSTLALNLSGNYFAQIPGDMLVKFPKLERLDLSNNRIRQLDPSYLCSTSNLVENLRELDVSGNICHLINLNQSTTTLNNNNDNSNQQLQQVYYLDKLFGCLQKLEKLSLSTNRFNHDTRSQLKSVAEQDQLTSSSDNNNVPVDDFDYLLASESSSSSSTPEDKPLDGRVVVRFGENHGSRLLRHLDLSDNKLTRMPLIQLEQASTLHKEIALNGTSNWINSRLRLETLSLNYNQIEKLDEFDVDNLTGLRKLHLNSNKLVNLAPRVFRKFVGLEELSLAGNRIQSLAPLNELFEQSTRSLSSLNLANNRISEWPHMLKQDHQSSSSSVNYATISQQMWPLEELNLSGNLLDTGNVSLIFDQLHQLKNLRVLNLNYNLISRIKSEWFKYANENLQRLSLSGNRINNIELGAFAPNQANDLTHLNLEFNVLKELRRKTFDSVTQLNELNLANNLIHTINSETFHQLNGLKVLKLNNNKLTSWKCEYFANLCNSITGNINTDLATLIHGPNYASAATAPTSGSVSALLELDLSYNSLSQLRTNSIAVHTKLEKLNLQNNKLSFIPHDLFRATISASASGRQLQLISSLKYLNLAHNRIQMIDNINFRPLKNLYSLDLSHNELQTLGANIIQANNHKFVSQQHQSNQLFSKIRPSNATVNQLDSDESSLFGPSKPEQQNQALKSTNGTSSDQSTSQHLAERDVAFWPALAKLRHLNVAFNQLTMVNQSIIAELNPFTLLNLNLSSNYLSSDSLPAGFYTKIIGASRSNQQTVFTTNNQSQPVSQAANIELVFSLKLESLDLNYNRLTEYPSILLDNHFASMELCNLAYNRIQRIPPSTSLSSTNSAQGQHDASATGLTSNALIHIKHLNLQFNPLNRESNELLLFEQRNLRHLNLAGTRLYAIQQASLPMNLDQLGGLSRIHQRSRLANQTTQLELIRSISKPIDAPYLQTLNLSSNQLVWLSANVFDRMQSLRVLDLSNNQLTRLHLLNSQLANFGHSLEHLNLASNLFTEIDSNDFSQLVRLRHLNLANLLSLNKLNCKFLSKLSTLQSLKLIDYPQLRQTLASLQAKLIGAESVTYATANQTLAGQVRISERQKMKWRNDLLYATIGRHCFKSAHNNELLTQPHDSLMDPNQANLADNHPNFGPQISYSFSNLDELELELFNNFENLRQPKRLLYNSNGGFKLSDELNQLLGPKMNKLTLVGLNLTSVSEDSFLGICGDELKLRVSYTSISRLPLEQILTSVARRTRLSLDFRNNIIQTIDSKSLNYLDELMQSNVGHETAASVRLSSNPIKCDCQTRPLWLWLNQHWTTANNGGQVSELQAQTDESSSDYNQQQQNQQNSNVNYWLRLRSISQTSDLKCYYPTKLRGKLTQHVNYNELVCKPNPTANQNVNSSILLRQSRKRLSGNTDSTNIGDNPTPNSSSDSDYLDEDDLDLLVAGESNLNEMVHSTRFNRYPSSFSATGNENPSLYFNNINLHVGSSTGSDSSDTINESGTVEETQQRQSLDILGTNNKPAQVDSGLPLIGRVGKRDQHSIPTNSVGIEQQASSLHNLRTLSNNNIHKFNFDSLNSLQKVPFGATGSKLAHHHRNSRWLTESDVLILTVAGSAMTILSFIIMAVCLFTSKLDQSEAHLPAANDISRINGKKFKIPAGMTLIVPTDSKGRPINVVQAKSSKTQTKTKLRSEAKPSSSLSSTSTTNGNNNENTGKKEPPATTKRQNPPSVPLTEIQQILVSGDQHSAATLTSRTNQNFLMRSPTIRRMHGLATGATDWLKYSLRAYPSGQNATDGTRRRLFIGGQQQIPTDQNEDVQHTQQNILTNLVSPKSISKTLSPMSPKICKILPAAMAAGCPLHAFTALQAMKEAAQDSRLRLESTDCSYCNHLLAAARQTKVVKFERTTKVLDNSRVDNSQLHDHITRTIIQQPHFEPNNRDSIEDHKMDDSKKSQHVLQSPRLEGVLIDNYENGKKMHSIGTNNKGQPSLRTFGSQNSRREREQSASSTATSSPPIKRTRNESQLPTIDVEGRFTYKLGGSDGLSESTSLNQETNICQNQQQQHLREQQLHLNRSQQHERDDHNQSVLSDQTLATSRADEIGSIMSASGCEDIFIIMPDSPNPSASTDVRIGSLKINCPDVIQLMPLDSPNVNLVQHRKQDLIDSPASIASCSPKTAYNDSITSVGTGPIFNDKQKTGQISQVDQHSIQTTTDNDTVIISRL